MYASSEFAELAGWARELTDHAGEDVGAAGRERARRAFLTSSRYELAFWQMAGPESTGWPEPRQACAAARRPPPAGMGLSDRQRAGSDAPNGIRRWDGSPWTTVPSTVVGAEKALAS